MARTLLFRVVEVKILRSATGWRVDVYLLIRGVGRAMHFEIGSAAELPGRLDACVKEAFAAVTGEALPGSPG